MGRMLLQRDDVGIAQQIDPPGLVVVKLFSSEKVGGGQPDLGGDNVTRHQRLGVPTGVEEDFWGGSSLQSELCGNGNAEAGLLALHVAKGGIHQAVLLQGGGGRGLAEVDHRYSPH